MKLSVLALALALTFTVTQQAKASSFVIDITQVGGNVVATGSGDIDLTGLFHDGSATAVAQISPSANNLFVGSGADDYYDGITGPSNFGSGTLSLATSSSGQLVGVEASGFGFTYLMVPGDYTSGTPFSSSATWSGEDATTLGITPGTYTWTWDSGADSLTINAFAAVPEPSQYGLGILLVFAGLFVARRIRAA